MASWILENCTSAESYLTWQLQYVSEERYPHHSTSYALVKHLLLSSSPQMDTLRFTLKVVCGIFFLIVIRGGVPRYRYDFLTKLGWVKFLTYVVTLFFVTFCLLILF